VGCVAGAQNIASATSPQGKSKHIHLARSGGRTPPLLFKKLVFKKLRLSEGSFLNGLPRVSLGSGHTHSDYYVTNATPGRQKSTPEEEIKKLRNALRLTGHSPPKKIETLAGGWDFLDRGGVYYVHVQNWSGAFTTHGQLTISLALGGQGRV
jgi:hypothetical protein